MIFKNSFYTKINLLLKSINNELVKDFNNFKNDRIFLLVLFIGLILRLFHLSQPIKGDEASTFLAYVEPINPFRVFVYTLPNNHIFHTILIKISTLIFGISLVSIRLPAFLASIGIIYFVYAICKRFEQNGLIAMISTAFWPYLIAYSSNSRGYSLFCFFSLLLVYLYLIFRDQLNSSIRIIISILCSLGLYTLPTFFIFVVAFFSWISFDTYYFSRSKKNQILNTNLHFIFLTSIFSLFLYFPVFLFSPAGYKSVINNNFVKSIPINIFLENIWKSIYSTINELTQFLPASYLLILSILLILGFCKYLSDSKFLAFSLLPIILFSSFIIILIKLVLPPERTWIFLVPYFLIVIDNGFSSLNLNLLSKKKIFYSVILSFAISFLFIIKPFLSKPFTDIESQAFPEAEQTIKYLETQRILVGKEEMGAYYLSGTTMPLNYYNWLHNGKLYFNDGKVYSRMSFYESFKIDWQRFLDSNWQEKRNRINDIDFYIVNKRNKYIKDEVITYEKLVNNYPLVVKFGSLEIYSSKIKLE